MLPRLTVAVLVCLSVEAAGGPAEAQYFGRNKVEYLDFEYRVFETVHFDVYHYPDEEPAARLAARLAERWYARLAAALGHHLTSRQPLVLYGSHPEFAQTNVVSTFLGDGIGGVTESLRRRIVMPFAPTLRETDQILGHEIAHAFQFDILSRHGGTVGWPGWFIEGMAQYLSLGSTGLESTMWLRDAVAHELLPDDLRAADRRFSPYLFGHAFWAHLAGRLGDGFLGDVMRAEGKLTRRVQDLTGIELERLYDDWRQATYAIAAGQPGTSSSGRPLLAAGRRGQYQLGPALSPDGRQVAFFSERDRLSLDLYLADRQAGRVVRKLATTAASTRFESLQAIRSAGAWSPGGDRFAFAALTGGKPTLVIQNADGSGDDVERALPRVGQILAPSWSPDGTAIAFSLMAGGVTDLYVIDVASGTVRQLTDDLFADLQPVWSPDGHRLAFATDRFTSDPQNLAFGRPTLATIDLRSLAVSPLAAFHAAGHSSPQWSEDGASIYFVAAIEGLRNVYRVELATGALWQVTRVPAGIAGLSETSPALSVARGTPALAYSTYRRGSYVIELLEGPVALAGSHLDAPATPLDLTLPAAVRVSRTVDRVPDAQSHAADLQPPIGVRPYRPRLSLEAVGQPYVSSGGGPMGTFVRAGGSLLFGDMLGERKLAATVQVGSRLRDLAVGVRYLNRERRWNWGAIVEFEPSISRIPRHTLTEIEGEPAVRLETDYFHRFRTRLAGLVAYPLNRARRLEFTVGARHMRYRHDVRTRVRSLPDGRLLDESELERSGEAPATLADASAALVGDTAVFGPTGPILGSRYRFELSPTLGSLSLTRVLADYRRYLMPVRPYTLATRVMHYGQYGDDARDPRQVPTFLGSRQFVRGYGWGDIKCEWTDDGECAAVDALLGSRLLVSNLELRVPLLGALSKDLSYGPIPIEAFVFGDAGMAWSTPDGFETRVRRQGLVRSAGAGVRVNAGGLPFEFAVVHAFDAPARGWSFDFGFRPGF